VFVDRKRLGKLERSTCERIFVFSLIVQKALKKINKEVPFIPNFCSCHMFLTSASNTQRSDSLDFGIGKRNRLRMDRIVVVVTPIVQPNMFAHQMGNHRRRQKSKSEKMKKRIKISKYGKVSV
jgi:hypothetical protein